MKNEVIKLKTKENEVIPLNSEVKTKEDEMHELETSEEVVENHDEIAEYEKVSRKSEYRIKLDNQLRELGFNPTDFSTLDTRVSKSNCKS
jgi:alanine racemase